MNIVFYVIIFIIGSLLGSFYVTKTRRMVKNKKVLSLQYYCTNCGEKIGITERIPILSYLFLRGKCKHCNQKIKPQYILFEVLGGILFLVLAYALKLSYTNIEVAKVVSFVFITLYFSYIILAIRMDKLTRNIPQQLLTYGIIISLIYIVYLCIVDSITIYKNLIYLVMIVMILLMNIITTKKRAQSSYVIDLLTTLLVMLVFTEEIICIITIIGTLISIALYILINRIRKLRIKGQKDNIKFNSRVRIALIMGTLNIIAFLALLIIYR